MVAVRSTLWRMRFLLVRYSNDLITRMVKVAAVLGAKVLERGSFVDVGGTVVMARFYMR